MEASSDLVPGRDCGPCVACCDFLRIEDTALQKPANTLCPHCAAGAGCAVYASRPQVCRKWHCAWRQYKFVEDDWRPDVSGLVMIVDGMDPVRVEFVVLARDKYLLTVRFATAVAKLLAVGALVSLSIPGPRGCLSALRPLNPYVQDAIRRRDLNGFIAGVRALLDDVDRRHVWARDPLQQRSAVAAAPETAAP